MDTSSSQPRRQRPLPRRQDRDKEPAWHRRARQQRSNDRMLLRALAAMARLARHHGSSPPRILRQLAGGCVWTSSAMPTPLPTPVSSAAGPLPVATATHSVNTALVAPSVASHSPTSALDLLAMPTPTSMPMPSDEGPPLRTDLGDTGHQPVHEPSFGGVQCGIASTFCVKSSIATSSAATACRFTARCPVFHCRHCQNQACRSAGQCFEIEEFDAKYGLPNEARYSDAKHIGHFLC
mmetsp:Transcript_130918/g.261178  ORF Transcript_130918/g.261178 Transcript_130918/m.261178 type:complete len:237 (-) Transcript_130918:151-861(-)